MRILKIFLPCNFENKKYEESIERGMSWRKVPLDLRVGKGEGGGGGRGKEMSNVLVKLLAHVYPKGLKLQGLVP